MVLFDRFVLSTFLAFTFLLKNMGREKMATVVDLTFDFHLNKSDNQVGRPFPLANRIEDPDRAPPGWVRAKREHLYWDDAFPASASLDQSSKASLTFSLLDVDETEGKLQQSTLSAKVLDIIVEGRLQFVVEDRFRLSREQGYWCGLGEPGMQAHHVIVTTSSFTDMYIPVNLYHFVFGLRFPMHWFLQRVLFFYQLSLN